MTVITIDFNVNDTRSSLEALLGRLKRECPGIASSEDAELDLRDCQFLGPTAVTTLSALRARAIASGRELRLIPPTHPQLLAYCEYAGLLEAFGVGPPPIPHPESVTTAVRRFNTLPLSPIDEVVRLVRFAMGLPTSDEHTLKLTLTELAQNVIDHARTSVGGFISARAYENERDVRFAVADLGVGFRESLARSHSVKSDLDAIRRAMEERVSSHSSSHNLGQGLKLLREIIYRNRGTLLLCSRGAWFELRNMRTTFGVFFHGVEYPGTIAVGRLLIRRPSEVEPEEENGDLWG